MTPTRFAITLTLIALGIVITAMACAMSHLLPVPMIIFAVVPGYTLLTAILYKRMKAAAQKSPQRFVTSFMASVTIKLMITAAFLAIAISLRKEEKVAIALWTFATYIAFTVLLVMAFQNHNSQERS
jgi:FtsH-binding integral membrane protein